MKPGGQMSRLVDEVKLWNTTAVGAFVLWRFTCGYTNNSPDGGAPSVLLHFLATPILMNPRISSRITRQRHGLQSYARSFTEKGEVDLLLGIQDRIRQKQNYTLASIDLAVAKGLLVWDTEGTALHARQLEAVPSRGCRPRASVEMIGNRGEIFGEWCAAHSIENVANLMGVSF